MISKSTSPNTILFTLTLILSILIIITASNWVILWIRIEINLIVFIPLILSTQTSYELEAATKYFLIQTIGSSIILISIFILNSLRSHISPPLFISRLVLKIGGAPFHYWVPQVLNSIRWINIIIISTLQKLGPIIIIINMSTLITTSSIITLAILNAAIGSIMGINQTQLRPLIAYSSITHLGWIFASALTSITLTIIYFSIYSITTLLFIAPIIKINKYSTNNFNLSITISNNQTLITTIRFLSLGGIPPLLGFIPKWIIICSLIHKSPILLLILILSSLLRLFYYLKIVFASTLNSNKSLSLKITPLTSIILISQVIIPPITMLSII